MIPDKGAAGMVPAARGGRRAAAGAALPGTTIAGALALWVLLTRLHVFPEYAFPSLSATIQALGEEFRAGRLTSDITASLFRVAVGFVLAAILGVPLGLWLGQRLTPRLSLQPLVNFFRCLSPLAWIPFAILWFGIGDKPAIFLIFMASFFPLTLATMAAVANVPAVYYRVARDYGFHGPELLTRVVFPAVLPQVITALRVTAGIAWVVVVAAEMVGCQDGLGYGIYDARNGQRLDIVAAYMLVIGLLGVGIDRLLAQLTRLPNVRWGYDR
ncbi:MAG: ABC transporter permease [Armatimonadetes bacterium]|nr:ABC transporter permease [Armatimonadota bacterium]